MLGTLVKTLAEPWAHRWKGTAIGSAVLFWLAGAIVYLITHDRAEVTCTTESPLAWCTLYTYPRIGPALLAIVGVLVIGASAVLAARLAPFVFDILAAANWTHLRALAPVARLGRFLHQLRRTNTPVPAPDPSARPAQQRRIEAKRRRALQVLAKYPAPATPARPTAVGNRFAVVEEHALTRFGLELGDCWPYLVDILPATARTQLTEQTNALLLRVQALIFAVATFAWTPLLHRGWVALWAAVALGLTIGAYSGVLTAAGTLADGMRTVVVLHRMRLYDALGLKRPTDSDDEPARGAALSAYLLGDNPAAEPLSWPSPLP